MTAKTLDLYGVKLAPASPTDERVHFGVNKNPGQIYRRGNHWFRVTRRIMAGVCIVTPFKPWGHR